MSHSGFLSLLGLTGNRNQKSENTAIAGGLRYISISISLMIPIPQGSGYGAAPDPFLYCDNLNAATQPDPPCGRETPADGSDPERKNSQVAMRNLVEQVSVSDQPNQQQLKPLLHPCLSW